MFLIISEIYLFLFRTHVIYVNGNNLFTIDGMKICDPEAGMFKNTDGYVVESGGVRGYPLQRMITVGANVTF